MMNLQSIEYTVRVMCAELDLTQTQITYWEKLSEEELLYEMVICIFGSQMLFEVAVAAADRIKCAGLLYEHEMMRNSTDYQARILQALEKRLDVSIEGRRKKLFPRFRNRLSLLLAKTIENIHGRGQSLHSILKHSESGGDARKKLVKSIFGFGPKQASLFLRRIGFSSNLAVLDTHVLDYMKLATGTSPKASELSRISGYELLEFEFKKVAKRFGHGVGCVDLALWITMRVAKREFAI